MANEQTLQTTGQKSR